MEQELEQAWRELRRRVADHVSAMGEDDSLVLSAQVGELVDGPGPYVTVGGRPGGGWRLEAVSNGYLDSGHELSEPAEARLRELGWSAPTYLPGEGGAGSANWWLDLTDALDGSTVERLAWLLVATLREVYAVPHPAFLEAGGLDLAGLQGPDAPGLWDVASLPVVPPREPEHLQRLVDQTLGAMIERPVVHDEDGDVPWPCGEESLAYVQVDAERPVVHLFSVLVLGATQPAEGPAAVDLVSEKLPYLSVRMVGDRLVVHHELSAMPFVPQHLAHWVARLALELDDVAAEAAALLGGRRYLEEIEVVEDLVPAEEPTDEELVVVAELLAVGPVSPRVVAEVFDGDRSALVRRLVGLRQGRLHVDTDDLDGLLHALRSGLRWIVDEPDRAEDRRGRRRRLPPRPSVQSLLIDDEPDLFETGS